MIEEQGRVVAVAPDGVWVETVRRGTCASCSARSGCGQGLMDRLGVRERRGLLLARCDSPAQVGETVVVGIEESALLRGSVLVYLVPLLALFAAAIVVDALTGREPLSVLAGFAGFAAAWWWVRRRAVRLAGDPRMHPRIVRVEGQAPRRTCL